MCQNNKTLFQLFAVRPWNWFCLRCVWRAEPETALPFDVRHSFPFLLQFYFNETSHCYLSVTEALSDVRGCHKERLRVRMLALFRPTEIQDMQNGSHAFERSSCPSVLEFLEIEYVSLRNFVRHISNPESQNSRLVQICRKRFLVSHKQVPTINALDFSRLLFPILNSHPPPRLCGTHRRWWWTPSLILGGSDKDDILPDWHSKRSQAESLCPSRHFGAQCM